MSALPLLALGALLLLTRKKSDGATTRVVSKSPDLPPLPVYTTEQVFPEAAAPAAAAPAAPAAEVSPEVFPAAQQPQEHAENTPAAVDQWGPPAAPVPSPSNPVAVVQPPPEMDAAQEQPEQTPPVPIEPGQAAQAAAMNPGAPIEEVMRPDPVAAARELAEYAAANKGKGAKLGTKGAPSSTVKALQLQMGGGLVADGIYGPKTRDRGRELGVTMPPRA